MPVLSLLVWSRPIEYFVIQCIETLWSETLCRTIACNFIAAHFMVRWKYWEQSASFPRMQSLALVLLWVMGQIKQGSPLRILKSDYARMPSMAPQRQSQMLEKMQIWGSLWWFCQNVQLFFITLLQEWQPVSWELHLFRAVASSTRKFQVRTASLVFHRQRCWYHCRSPWGCRVSWRVSVRIDGSWRGDRASDLLPDPISLRPDNPWPCLHSICIGNAMIPPGELSCCFFTTPHYALASLRHLTHGVEGLVGNNEVY